MTETKMECVICERRGGELILNNLPMLVCGSCGLIWRKYFDLDSDYYQGRDFELSEEKIKARYSNSVSRIKIFKKYVDFNNICDVGCGEGLFLKALKDCGYKNIIGIEPSMKISEFAKENELDIRNEAIENIDNSFFRENNIKMITMLHVIEHLKNPLDLMMNIFKGLEKGGRLIIETPNMDSYLLKKLNYQYDLIYFEHLYYFNKKNIIRFLEKIGFKIIAVGGRDFDPDNMSIKESLRKLGILNVEKKMASKCAKNNIVLVAKHNFNFLRKIVRRFLSKMVVVFNREDYLWVVAEK